MKLEINENSSIKNIKKQFHSYFPFLKIEFFKESASGNAAFDKMAMYDAATILSEIHPLPGSGVLDFDETMTVHAFEQAFTSKFGLHVQVFRKSGTVYLETKNTDEWTLVQQNAEAKLSESSTDQRETTDFTDRDQWE